MCTNYCNLFTIWAKPPGDAYLKVIAVLLIAAVVSLFVLAQIFIGITNVMKRAMSHEK